MPVFKKRSMLSGMAVQEAMQKQVLQMPVTATVRQGIRSIIKFKANAVMVADAEGCPRGVVSKTDIMAAFYAGLPVDTPLGDIMVGPPHFCDPGDSLETAIDQLQTLGVHQIYVRSEDQEHAAGLLTYSDIVGLLYRYCRTCIRSGRCEKEIAGKDMPRLLVKDVMTHGVSSCAGERPLADVVEILSHRKLAALLVTNEHTRSAGTISKTDLVLAYTRGTGIDAPAAEIMNTPIAACTADTLLSQAIQQMFLSDIQRIFVREHDDDAVSGVLSLSDATRFRSGTCRACGAGRILEPLDRF